MLLCRFIAKGRTFNGVYIEAENTIEVIRGSILSNWEPTGMRFWVGDVKLLPPVVPSKIICVGKNYTEHAAEFDSEVPKEPLLFMKPPSAVIGDADEIIIPSWVGRVDYEGELAVIIKKRCKDVTPEDAIDYIAGLTCFNDVTARDLQKKDGQWTRAKGFDTFAPMGPFMLASPDIFDRDIVVRLNGSTVQSASTNDMVFTPAEIISFISKVMTLYPGDVIATGTPAGVGPLSDGDKVEVEITGIGVLTNRVVVKE